MMSATASLGLSLLWDTDVGLSHVDKYMYSSEEYIKAGAVLATGILHAGVRTEVDAAFALLAGHVESQSVPLKISAIIGYVAYVDISPSGLCADLAVFSDLQYRTRLLWSSATGSP